jgi:hypothetical protein
MTANVSQAPADVRCRSLTFVAHGTTIPSSPDSGFLWDVRLLLLLRLPVAAVVEEDVEPGAEEEAYAEPGAEEAAYAEPGVEEPGYAEPGAEEPAYAGPGAVGSSSLQALASTLLAGPLSLPELISV